MFDIVIIGAGVTGSAIARELSRYQYDTLVLDRNSDVCEGTSKANSGIVHAGFDSEPGSMMAKMNVRGNAMMEQLSRDLDFPFKRNGSLVLCFDALDMDKLEELLEKAKRKAAVGGFLRQIDLLIDGPYRRELDRNQPYRGSENQRLLPLTDRYLRELDSYYGQAEGRRVELHLSRTGSLLAGVPGREQAEIWENIKRIGEAT